MASQRAKTVNIIAPPLPVTYQKAATRSPFEDINTVSATADNAPSQTNPLNRYPLNLLRFVGIITENEQIRAYLITPDDKLYSIGIGDIIGDHNGKVGKITPSEMEVVEQFTEGGKPATQRIVTLQLKEESSNVKK